MRTLGFLFASVALAQDLLKTLPNNYQVVFENESVRVIHVHYAAQEKLPLHDHPLRPTVYVYLSDSSPVKFSHVEQHAFSVVRPAVKAGMFRVSPGRIEKHTVENLSDQPSDFLRIELKQVPLGHDEIAFRGNQAVITENDGAAQIFDSKVLTLRRLVIKRAHTERHWKLPTQGLLIAIKPADYVSGKQRMREGTVTWTPPDFDLASEDSAAHLIWMGLKH